jgi:hypothetical protein
MCQTRGDEWNLLANYLHQHPHSPSSVKLSVEDLFPRSEIQFAFRDPNHNFSFHYLSLEMGFRVVFPRSIVPIL